MQINISIVLAPLACIRHWGQRVSAGAFMPKHCVLSYRITLTNPRITMQFEANTKQISLQTFSSYPNCLGSLL
jgi:hypothetical protein